MAYFPGCSGFIINGGNFNLQTEDAARKRKRKDSECDSECEFDTKRHRCSSRISDGLMIVKAGDIKLHRELVSDSDNSYRIHAASHGGQLVAIKTFEGPRAKQDWKINIAFLKQSFHPNVLQIVGISDESSKRHFIQFHGITSEQKMQWLIANALGADLNTSVQLSMKAVKGIAAGLSYIKSQSIPIMYPGSMNHNQKWDNFDILTGYDNEPIIAFHLSSSIYEDGSVSQNFDIKTDARGIEVLNGLCQQLFSGANSIIYDDSPERKFDTYDGEGLPTATLEHEEGTSNPTERPKPCRKPRREVWWLDQGVTNQSLKSIARCFEERLNRSLLSSSNYLLPHIRSSKDDNLRRNMHQCFGYLREEITLTCDVSKSVIVSHTFPSQNELCLICHQLVQNPLPPRSSASSPQLTGAALSFGSFSPMGGPARQPGYRICDQCGTVETPAVKFRLCGGCITTQYCSQDCQKIHWPFHKPICQHAASQSKQASANAAAHGFVDENLAETLRKFTSVHTALLGWTGFQALQLKRVPANVRQNALLIELSYHHHAESHRRFSVVDTHVIPRTYICDPLVIADIKRCEERCRQSRGIGTLIVIIRCGSTSQVMPIEVDPPTKIAWDSRDDWANVLSHFVESGRTDFKPISTTLRGIYNA